MMNKNKKIGLYRKLLIALCVLLLYSSCIYAQTQGIAALGTVATTIKQYIVPVQQVIYAIASIVALGGGISVYIKMNNEDQDVKKAIMMIVGACIFLVSAAQALPAFFN